MLLRKQLMKKAKWFVLLIRTYLCRKFLARLLTAMRNAISSLGLTRKNPFFLLMPLSIRPYVLFEMMKQLQLEQTVRENHIAVVAA